MSATTHEEHGAGPGASHGTAHGAEGWTLSLKKDDGKGGHHAHPHEEGPPKFESQHLPPEFKPLYEDAWKRVRKGDHSAAVVAVGRLALKSLVETLERLARTGAGGGAGGVGAGHRGLQTAGSGGGGGELKSRVQALVSRHVLLRSSEEAAEQAPLDDKAAGHATPDGVKALVRLLTLVATQGFEQTDWSRKPPARDKTETDSFGLIRVLVLVLVIAAGVAAFLLMGGGGLGAPPPAQTYDRPWVGPLD